MIVLNGQLQVKRAAQGIHRRRQPAVAAAGQCQRAVLNQHAGDDLRLSAAVTLTVSPLQCHRRLRHAILTAEELPQCIMRHFAAVPVRLQLNTAAEILLQRTRHLQTVILLQQPGGTAFS